jgi:Flagellin and related hook-associated proteins
MYTQTAQSLAKANERYMNINEKISEESSIVRPSDDPNGAGQVLNYQAENARNDQYEKTMTLAKNALDYEEVSLDSLNTSMDRANRLLIQAQNSANDDVDLESIAEELSLIVDSMADLMNSKDANGNYIFLGPIQLVLQCRRMGQVSTYMVVTKHKIMLKLLMVFQFQLMIRERRSFKMFGHVTLLRPPLQLAGRH